MNRDTMLRSARRLAPAVFAAKTGENEFLVTGTFCRVDFKAANVGQRDFLRVQLGTY